jgi:hypothetical protein
VEQAQGSTPAIEFFIIVYFQMSTKATIEVVCGAAKLHHSSIKDFDDTGQRGSYGSYENMKYTLELRSIGTILDGYFGIISDMKPEKEFILAIAGQDFWHDYNYYCFHSRARVEPPNAQQRALIKNFQDFPIPLPFPEPQPAPIQPTNSERIHAAVCFIRVGNFERAKSILCRCVNYDKTFEEWKEAYRFHPLKQRQIIRYLRWLYDTSNDTFDNIKHNYYQDQHYFLHGAIVYYGPEINYLVSLVMDIYDLRIKTFSQYYPCEYRLLSQKIYDLHKELSTYSDERREDVIDAIESKFGCNLRDILVKIPETRPMFDEFLVADVIDNINSLARRVRSSPERDYAFESFIKSRQFYDAGKYMGGFRNLEHKMPALYDAYHAQTSPVDKTAITYIVKAYMRPSVMSQSELAMREFVVNPVCKCKCGRMSCYLA